MKKYELYKSQLAKIADIGYTIALQGWDQETYMPEKGADFRAQQTATLSGIAHELATDKELGILLKKLNGKKDLTEKQKMNIARSLKDYKKSKKYSSDFVQLLSRTTSECFQAWQKAKKTSNFKLYAPHLTKMVDLKRKEADLLGYKKHPYNALLDQHEPGATVADLDILFKEVRENLVDFVKKIAAAKQNDDSFAYNKKYVKDKQWDFGIDLLKQMHFDFEAGRQDISMHPFTTNFNPLDVRITTKILENNLKSMIWSCIHEGGHALYEQGLPASEYGLPSGEAISLGIHESQSRMWENNVGRSLPYWKANYKRLQSYFPENLKNVSLEQFYKAINLVKPSLIRIEADELTYHFHVLIRYEIEKALMEGKIKVAELPEYWNEHYKKYLGVKVPNDAEGVLQDVHWSHGSIGYFPTYSLGSFYAAQFFHQANKDVKNLQQEIEKGNMLPLLKWLRENIHKHGKFYSAEELCKRVTGEKLNFKYFMNYAKNKYSHIYNLKN